MPDRVVIQSEGGTQTTADTPSTTRSNDKLFSGPDPSIHMLGLPKSHPQIGRWVAAAIVAGAIAALSLIAIFAH
jgi:hypothetical protein